MGTYQQVVRKIDGNARRVSAGMFVVAALLTSSLRAGPGVDELGVYRGPANANTVASVGEYETWLGRPVDHVLGALFPSDTWDHATNPGWAMTAWQNTIYKDKIVYAVPMVVAEIDPLIPGQEAQGDDGLPASLEKGAMGKYNHHYRHLGELLVGRGMPNVYLRLGWEFNGSWYKWAATGKEAAFAQYFRQIVETMRAVPGQNFRFIWNPSVGNNADLVAAYPGDDVVDFIGMDTYDHNYAAETYPLPSGATEEEKYRRRINSWNSARTRTYGMDWLAAFAQQHGKPLVIPEWGTWPATNHGGGDNPDFIRWMHDWIDEHDVAWHSYFDYRRGDGGEDSLLGSPTTAYPNAAAMLLSLWNPSVPKPPAPPAPAVGQELMGWNFESGSAGWTPISGTWAVVSEGGSNVYKQSGGGLRETVAVNPGLTDYSYEADVRVENFLGGGGTSKSLGLYTGYVNSNTWYAFTYAINSNGEHTASITRRMGSTTTVLQRRPVLALAKGKSCKFRAVMNQGLMEFWIKDRLAASASVSDLPSTAGKVGMRLYNTAVSFDNVKIRAIPAETYVSMQSSQLSGYDTQTGSGTAVVGNGGQSLTLSGNIWQKHPFAYAVTANTVLEVTVNSSNAAEIIGIGLDADNDYDNQSRNFRLGGSQMGVAALHYLADPYTSGEGPVTYVIPVGAYYTGAINYLTFIMDDDASSGGHVTFSDIRVYEQASALQFTQGSISSYGGTQDAPGSAGTVGLGGSAVTITGNVWKKHPLSYTVTANTVLEVTVSASDAGEILGIALENDNNGTNTPKRTFRLGGSDVAVAAYDSWSWQISPAYMAGSGSVAYSIPLGSYFTGSVSYLGFVGDDDANASTNATFSNIRIYEP